MSRYTLIALSVLLFAGALLPACAQQSTTPATPAQARATVKAAAPREQAAAAAVTEMKEAGNKICPITGSKVGSMEEGAHVEYKGYRVGLCCNGCKEKFLTAPEENLKKALERK
jgi:YHS domain-containing protein